MDATTQAFVTEIVSRKIAENWLYWLLFLAASFLAAFAGAYIKRRAENLATRDDFDLLRRQLQQTTRLTEEIKSEVSHQEWRAREANSIRRVALEKLVRTTSACLDSAYGRARDLAFGDETVSATSEEELSEARMLASLYFPELRNAVVTFERDVRNMIGWGYSRRREYLALSEEDRKSEETLEVTKNGIVQTYQAAALSCRAVADGAVDVMARLLDGASNPPSAAPAQQAEHP